MMKLTSRRSIFSVSYHNGTASAWQARTKVINNVVIKSVVIKLKLVGRDFKFRAIFKVSLKLLLARTE